ncbi:serine hydrolase [Enterobacteriaceae bacterium RIT692]|nr:serine hydrolase [Enterobacteriaceae bacterium RIT692]
MQGLLQTVIQQALDQQRLVGVEVMAAQRGEIIYHQAAGWADRENQRPMAKRGHFRLASVSKLIVSTAAMVLVAQGSAATISMSGTFVNELRDAVYQGLWEEQ